MEANQPSHASAEKVGASNRQQRRRMLLIPRRPQVRSGSRTGTTPHFRLWMADLRMRSALQRTRTARLAEIAADSDVQAASALAILATQRKYRNAFAIVTAEREDLLALNGIGPKRLEALESYFRSKHVKPRWVA